MTLIVGIKCADGVVIGADSAATFATATGQATAMQPTSKLHILAKPIIMGVSGDVGMGQLHCDRVAGLWAENKLGRNYKLSQVKRELIAAIFEDVKVAAQRAESFVPFMGQATLNTISTTSMIALPVGGLSGTPELIEVEFTGQITSASDSLPYFCIGNGKPLADPFLGFLRRIFWPDSIPKVVDGIFAIMWTLHHSILVSPGGVAGPIHLAVLSKGKGNELSARLLRDEEIGEHRQHVSMAEEHLRCFGDYQSNGELELPEVPKED